MRTVKSVINLGLLKKNHRYPLVRVVAGRYVIRIHGVSVSYPIEFFLY